MKRLKQQPPHPFLNLTYFWLHWVFSSLVRGATFFALHVLPISGASLVGSTGSAGVAHGLRCSLASLIFPYRVPGSNPCPLHWQADPQSSAPHRDVSASPTQRLLRVQPGLCPRRSASTDLAKGSVAGWDSHGRGFSPGGAQA